MPLRTHTSGTSGLSSSTSGRSPRMSRTMSQRAFLMVSDVKCECVRSLGNKEGWFSIECTDKVRRPPWPLPSKFWTLTLLETKSCRSCLVSILCSVATSSMSRCTVRSQSSALRPILDEPWKVTAALPDVSTLRAPSSCNSPASTVERPGIQVAR